MEKIGRYQVEHEIGRGAMGVVYRAFDPAIGRRVAVKALRMDQLGDGSNVAAMRDRVFREAQSAGILSHPNIVTIYDIAEEGGAAYIFMEYVEGATLDSFARGMPRRELIGILEQAAEALDYAHSKGIVHRDVKPANLMLSGTTLKVTDFGVARLRHRDSTQSGTLLGTPSYMSPEQVAGAEVTGAADQYALGVVAYEFLAGVKPFENDNLANLLYRITQQEPPPVSWLPAGTNAVLQRVLAKRPGDRYTSCQEFVAALAESLGEGIAVATPVREASGDEPTVAAVGVPVVAVEPVAPVAAPAIVLPPPAVRAEPPARSQQGLIWGIVASVVLMMGGLWYWFFYPAAPPPANGTTPGVASNPAIEAGKPSAALGGEGNAPSALPSLPTERTVEKEGEQKPVATTSVEPKPVETKPQQPRNPAEDERVHTISFTSNPDGAEILINDGNQDRCPKTPCSLDLPAGSYKVTGRLEGYEEFTRNLRVPDASRVFVEFDKAVGTLAVNSNPSGANLRLNGKELPNKTPALLKLPAGRYKLEVVKEGLPVQERDVSVRNGVLQTLTVTWYP